MICVVSRCAAAAVTSSPLCVGLDRLAKAHRHQGAPPQFEHIAQHRLRVDHHDRHDQRVGLEGNARHAGATALERAGAAARALRKHAHDVARLDHLHCLLDGVAVALAAAHRKGAGATHQRGEPGVKVEDLGLGHVVDLARRGITHDHIVRPERMVARCDAAAARRQMLCALDAQAQKKRLDDDRNDHQHLPGLACLMRPPHALSPSWVVARSVVLGAILFPDAHLCGQQRGHRGHDVARVGAQRAGVVHGGRRRQRRAKPHGDLVAPAQPRPILRFEEPLGVDADRGHHRRTCARIATRAAPERPRWSLPVRLRVPSGNIPNAWPPRTRSSA
jgi:hypothetical protein